MRFECSTWTFWFQVKYKRDEKLKMVWEYWDKVNHEWIAVLSWFEVLSKVEQSSKRFTEIKRGYMNNECLLYEVLAVLFWHSRWKLFKLPSCWYVIFIQDSLFPYALGSRCWNCFLNVKEYNRESSIQWSPSYIYMCYCEIVGSSLQYISNLFQFSCSMCFCLLLYLSFFMSYIIH